ncbi:Ger(x)C family spore germination protein [Paenibacillus methanolicus]|uniref:Spore germination protein KC n=1 Tax=Paenibacillus methanolicus TaxID=582686 RepID=A0A5S5CKK4_9BACL|nr:Ger(x)C family spore germination protein [Paenibacillus methanolicus]TYP79255.1 spore germination protein KC [Paenibacillus methanolicus]
MIANAWARRMRRLASLPCGLAILLLTSGCWSSTEISDLAIITMIGIDAAENGNFRLSALIIRPLGGNQQAVSAQQSSTTVVAEAEGANLFDAMRKLSFMMSKRLYWSHLDIIVMSESIARSKLAPSLDFFNRQHQFRKNIVMLVTRSSAADILKTSSQLEGSLGAEIHGQIRNSRLAANTMITDLNDFNRSLLQATTDHITGEISVTKGQKLALTVNQKRASMVYIRGAAVFRENQLVGWLDREQTRGVLWLRGKVHGGIAYTPCPSGSGEGKISYEYTRETASVRPIFQDSGDVRIEAKVHVEGGIGEVTCPGIDLSSDGIRRLNDQLKQDVTEEIESALRLAKDELQADVFGFGQAIYRANPKLWAKLAPSWHSGGLRELVVELSVDADIRRSGLMHEPVYERGAPS